jgi:hypothetical protein
MNHQQINNLIQYRLDYIERLLTGKAEEYATNKNPFHNFDTAAAINNCSPEQALWGMYTKHLISVKDMVEATANPDSRFTEEYIQEKISDSIAYHLLLEAMLTRRYVPTPETLNPEP